MAKDEMTPIRCKIILALADNGMRACAAAKSLYMHPKNVFYHIKIVKAITGKDPKNFYDLVDLVSMAREIIADGY